MASHEDDYYVQQQHGQLSEGQVQPQVSHHHGPHQAHHQYDVAFPERFPDADDYLASSTAAQGEVHPQSPFDVGPFMGDDFFTLPTSPPAATVIGPASTSAAALGSLSATATISEDLVAAAVEEDKRRRNTAASARFRLKKKEREADLERRSKEMTDRVNELQKRIGVLETENRWLRELITERSKNRVFPTSTSGKGKQKESQEEEKERESVGSRRRRSGS